MSIPKRTLSHCEFSVRRKLYPLHIFPYKLYRIICVKMNISEYRTHSTLCPLRLKAPLTICINLLSRYIYLQFMPPLAIHGKFNKNERTLWLRWTRGRLELTVPPYIESSYLLASNTPTKRLAMWQQARSWWWYKYCIAFSDRTHSVPSLMISWSFALQNWATMSFIASCTRQWRTVLPLLFPLCSPQWGKGAHKWD